MIVDSKSLKVLVRHSSMSFTEKLKYNLYLKNLYIAKQGDVIENLDQLNLNFELPSTAIMCIENVLIEGQYHTICSLSDGRLLQFIVDCEIL